MTNSGAGCSFVSPVYVNFFYFLFQVFFFFLWQSLKDDSLSIGSGFRSSASCSPFFSFATLLSLPLAFRLILPFSYDTLVCSASFEFARILWRALSDDRLH
ncbi:hypothetical protein IE53DRAFT_278638 [Violaceomyces palustris]|uniref:Uncharacterized protein n=1 Tax=Violaceomyces palustris TaxID=1673888 RepID=A0ACD0NMF2_9BASI|nr:hypothetical protein IE53DRAFT_278638 [Violaceomyces palustris]